MENILKKQNSIKREKKERGKVHTRQDRIIDIINDFTNAAGQALRWGSGLRRDGMAKGHDANLGAIGCA